MNRKPSYTLLQKILNFTLSKSNSTSRYLILTEIQPEIAMELTQKLVDKCLKSFEILDVVVPDGRNTFIVKSFAAKAGVMDMNIKSIFFDNTYIRRTHKSNRLLRWSFSFLQF